MRLVKTLSTAISLTLLFLVVSPSLAASAPTLTSLEKRIRALETKIATQEARIADQAKAISSLKSRAPKTASLYFVSSDFGFFGASCPPPSFETDIIAGKFIVSAVYGDRSGKLEKYLINCRMDVLIP